MAKILNYWNQREYYRVAEKASEDTNYLPYQFLGRLASKAKRILDLGCGEGTRLALLRTKGERYGVDISKTAIKIAQRKFPKIKFLRGDIENLPFTARLFDLVYSMFVLEHTENPEKVLREAARVLAKGGFLLLAAPNYGSPNRRSPNSKEGKLEKLSTKRHIDKDSLGWTTVIPQKSKYAIDIDTTIEPYIGTLVPFLENLGLKIQKTSSLWDVDEFSVKQLPLRILGGLGISPFVWWGPQLFVIAKK